MDARRSRVIGIPADLYESPVGRGILERFGADGAVVFLGFVASCKRNYTAGQITYTNDADALAVIGLPGLHLDYPLDSLWDYLSRRHWTRKRRHGTFTTVEFLLYQEWDEALRWQYRRPIPRAIRAAVFTRDAFQCQECGSTDDLTLDHIHPYSLGGEDTEANLRVLCRSCNSRKGARV